MRPTIGEQLAKARACAAFGFCGCVSKMHGEAGALFLDEDSRCLIGQRGRALREPWRFFRPLPSVTPARLRFRNRTNHAGKPSALSRIAGVTRDAAPDDDHADGAMSGQLAQRPARASAQFHQMWARTKFHEGAVEIEKEGDVLSAPRAHAHR